MAFTGRQTKNVYIPKDIYFKLSLYFEYMDILRSGHGGEFERARISELYADIASWLNIKNKRMDRREQWLYAQRYKRPHKINNLIQPAPHDVRSND